MFSFLKFFRSDYSGSDTPEHRRSRLFSLIIKAMDTGVSFGRIKDVDRFIDNREAAVFLKHDVHGLQLAKLCDFAAEEAELGIFGSYFFMAPDHPHTRPLYSSTDQLRTMQEIQQMGHEVGLHIDPYFLIHETGDALHQILDSILEDWRSNGLVVNSANMHGNSLYKGLDSSGYGTSFDFFSEIARQRDYPELKNVDSDLAELISQNRVCLQDYGILYWGDTPLWSQRHKYVVTNYLTDNLLEKTGKIKSIIHPDTISMYKLCNYQPPGARNVSEAREYIEIGASCKTDPGERDLSFSSSLFDSYFKKICCGPLQILLHPQHYI